MSSGRKLIGVVAMAAGLAGAGRSTTARQLTASACRFAGYYHALEAAGPSFLDRVALSLVLTQGECHKQSAAKPTAS